MSVLGDELGKDQLTALTIIRIFGITHYYPPFCGLSTAWVFRSYTEQKKPGSRNTGLKSLIEQTIKAEIGRISENNSEYSKNASQR